MTGTLRLVLALLLMLIATSGCQHAAKPAAAAPTTAPAAKEQEELKKTLYDRIGGEATIVAVVDDLIARAMADRAVNFSRSGTPHAWQPTPQNVALLKTRLIQFLGTATGGPQQYEGEDLRTGHRGMRITGAEFDAFVRDVGVSLQQVGVKEKERKEVLEIVQSAKGSIVERAPTH